MSHSVTITRTDRLTVFGRCVQLACFVFIVLDGSQAWSQPKEYSKESLTTLYKLNTSGWGDADEQGNALKVRISEPSDDRLAELVRAFPKLEMLYLSGRDVTQPTVSPMGLRHIERLPALKSLWLLDTSFTDQRAEVVSRLTNLKDLYIVTGIRATAGMITEKGIASLSHLKSLESLTVTLGFDDRKRTFGEQSPADDAIGAALLRTFPQLKRLAIGGPGVSSLTMRELETLTHLESLSMNYPLKISTADFRHVRNLTRLEEIRFSAHITDDWLAHLAPVKSLKRIGFGRNVTDAGMAHLAGLTNVEALRIESEKITDKSLASLQDMTKLRSLELYSPKIDGSGFVHLGQLKQLQLLKLPRTGYRPEHVHHLARLTALKHLDVSGTPLNGTPLNQGDNWKSLGVLKDLKHLEVIEIELGPDATQALEKMLPGCRVYYDD